MSVTTHMNGGNIPHITGLSDDEFEGLNDFDKGVMFSLIEAELETDHLEAIHAEMVADLCKEAHI